MSIVGGRTGDRDGQRGDTSIRINGSDGEVPDFSIVIAQQLQDLLDTIIAQVGNHASNIQGDVTSVNVGNGINGCLYKEFMTCNPKDYDGKGGAIVYTHWIKIIESVYDMSGCGANHKKLAMLRTLIVFMSLLVVAIEPTTIQSVILKAGMLTDGDPASARNLMIAQGACFECGDIEPSNLGFSYEIEIASGQQVEINKVIRDYKLEIEGYTFDIDLIPFGHKSFDMIVRMDRLSWHKDEIVCHENVVRIPLQDGEILRVLGEKLEENVRYLMSAKTKELKLKEIIVVRNFPDVFPDDLSDLPPS
nr:putative reverse transcriptase domain-containing protein [Tanacetum cinerariifolium]